jgi:hypothetical protein
MFRNQSQPTTSFVTLAALAITLSFAAGCNNTVVGPERGTMSVLESPPVPEVFHGFNKAGLSETTTLPGDLTGDGQVDASDLAAFAFLMRADVNLDGIVNDTDSQVIGSIVSGQVPDLAQPIGVIDASDYAAYAAAKGRADLNMDGHVDASDLAFFAWMRARGDLDHDGVVSRRDRQIIRPEVTP